MKCENYIAALGALLLQPAAFSFEGRINAVQTQGGQTQLYAYSVGARQLRIECAESARPHAIDIVDLDTGAITLLFPHNRSFVKLGKTVPVDSSPISGTVGRPGLPGVVRQSRTERLPADLPRSIPTAAHFSPSNLPGLSTTPSPSTMPGASSGIGSPMGAAPAMPATMMRPSMPMEPAELKATGQTTNLLGYTCWRYELKQRGEVMEIWATDKLLPFQPYLQNQPPPFGQRTDQAQWGHRLKARKLFPLLAVLKSENGPPRMRFEVTTIQPEKIEDEDGAWFQPPSGYQEVEPLPF